MRRELLTHMAIERPLDDREGFQWTLYDSNDVPVVESFSYFNSEAMARADFEHVCLAFSTYRDSEIRAARQHGKAEKVLQQRGRDD